MPRRNRTHEREIDALIPEAEALADQQVVLAQCPDYFTYSRRWDAVYFRAMDVLAYQAGLRRMSWQGGAR